MSDSFEIIKLKKIAMAKKHKKKKKQVCKIGNKGGLDKCTLYFQNHFFEGSYNLKISNK